MIDAGFHDVLFPGNLALGARAELIHRTDVVSLASGAEVRRGRWSLPLRRWDLSTIVQDYSAIRQLQFFFDARQGRRFSFRFRDPIDQTSAPHGTDPHPDDQVIGTGDGLVRDFPLLINMGMRVRPIGLPVADSVRVAVDGLEMTEGWELSADGGIIFNAPPANGSAITAGFLFDIPARFDSDVLRVVMGDRGGHVEGLSIVEVRL